MKAKALTLALLASTLVGCSYELQHNLNEDDANDIYTLLAKNGINAKKLREEGGNEPTYVIVVAKTDAAQATELLREHSLPRPQHPGWEGIAKSKGMIPTEMEQRAMFLEALQGEIERGLNKIDGVLEVHAIPMQPENTDLTQPDKKPQNSAAILIKYRPNAEGRPPMDERAIREWVASALPDTRPENVKVVLSQSLPTSQELTEASRLVTVLGMQMTAASASEFKTIAGGIILAVVVASFFVFVTLIRGGRPASGRPRRV